MFIPLGFNMVSLIKVWKECLHNSTSCFDSWVENQSEGVLMYEWLSVTARCCVHPRYFLYMQYDTSLIP